jgi:hypothetical protein
MHIVSIPRPGAFFELRSLSSQCATSATACAQNTYGRLALPCLRCWRNCRCCTRHVYCLCNFMCAPVRTGRTCLVRHHTGTHTSLECQTSTGSLLILY